MATFNLYNRSSGTTKNFPKAADELKVEIEFVDDSTPGRLGIPGFSEGRLGKVVGYLSKKFEYDATGNYSNLFDVKSFSDSLVLNLLKDETQRNFANYGYLTKKVYNQGFSPTLSIDFRCYAGDGDHAAHFTTDSKNVLANPIAIANALVNATLPRVGKNAIFNVKSATNLPIVDQAVKGLMAVSELALHPIDRGDNQNVQNASNNADASVEKAISQLKDIDNLTSRKPPTCNVKIGNIFQKDMMVIKQVHVELSMEYLSPGIPLYGDFSVTLESLFNAAVMENGSKDTDERIFGSGLNVTGSKNRVSFDKGASVPPTPINDPSNTVTKKSGDKWDEWK